MRRVFLAGASGSIGQNTQLCIEYLNGYYRKTKKENLSLALVGISAKNNLGVIRKILNRFPVEVAAIDSSQNLKLLKKEYPKVKFYRKSEEAVEQIDFDLLINALSGGAGLKTTIQSITKKAAILLANKESLVMAGKIIKKALKKYQSCLIPIDSEHSAIFSLLRCYRQEQINRVIITASGGPFFKKANPNPQPQAALRHPNWQMGAKISIDSATMMNKGLEVIEAHYLFDLPYEKIDTIIHPQSVLHSLIETVDGEQYAQLGLADMKHPIQNALTYPEILPSPMKKFNLFDYPNLEFYPPDFQKFPLLQIAYECGRKGGSHLVVMNAANEEAVHCFLEGKIQYSDIEKLVVQQLSRNNYPSDPSLEEILLIDSETKMRIKEQLG